MTHFSPNLLKPNLFKDKPGEPNQITRFLGVGGERVYSLNEADFSLTIAFGVSFLFCHFGKGARAVVFR